MCECVCLCLGATYVYGYGVLSFAACVVGVQPGCFCSLLTCFFGYPLSFMLILSDAWPRCMSARPCLSCPCTGCPLHPRAMTGRRQGSRVASCVGRSTRCVSVVLCVCVTAVTSTATLLLSHPPHSVPTAPSESTLLPPMSPPHPTHHLAPLLHSYKSACCGSRASSRPGSWRLLRALPVTQAATATVAPVAPVAPAGRGGCPTHTNTHPRTRETRATRSMGSRSSAGWRGTPPP